jgi:archaellum component FlaF (FlaF/FlaG flagellin family)
MSANAVYPPSGSSGELQFVNSSGLLDAAQAFWDSANSKLFISGNLEVLGTETVIDSLHLQVEDRIIGLATGSAGEGSAGDRGLIFLIDGETNPSFYWDESADEFRLSRLTNVPGDATFNDPEAGGEGDYQNLKVGILKSKAGGVFDTADTNLIDVGRDTFFFVSGSDGSKDTTTIGTSVFGGDVVISGTLYGGSPLKIGGELEFKTTPGGTTSIQNKDGSVKVFASKEVKIGSDDGLIRLIDLGGSTAGIIYLTGSISPVTDRRFKLLSKGQIHLHGGHPHAPSPGEDIFVFVSGAMGSKRASVKGVTLFGGDAVMSGSSTMLGGVSGSLTRLVDDTSYLVAGNDITIASASNGSITITSNAQDKRDKFVYDVTGSHSAQSPLNIPVVNFSSVGFDPKRIDVFVNGQLMTSGSSKDYILPGTDSLSFYFGLISGDIISIRTH